MARGAEGTRERGMNTNFVSPHLCGIAKRVTNQPFLELCVVSAYSSLPWYPTQDILPWFGKAHSLLCDFFCSLPSLALRAIEVFCTAMETTINGYASISFVGVVF